MLLPALYFLCVSVNVFAIVYEGSSYLGFDKWSLWSVIALSLGVGVLVALITQFIIVPRLKKHIWVKSFTLTGILYS
uniref:Uncharacterized protein n=1 Tax=Ditylenchus dipsaci TaxID=166011 RepID=A0A915EVG9_9BILA